MGNRQNSCCGSPDGAMVEVMGSEQAEVTEVSVGGQQKLSIKCDGAEVEVYLLGATLTKFKTSDGQDAIWLSSCAKLDGTKAIRGGIPLVFPQFGQPITEMAQHGFARNNVWTLESKIEKGVVLSLDSTQATHDAWKHPYKLCFTIQVDGQQLQTTLSVMNIGSGAFSFHSLQHTYLNVGDITRTSVGPLAGYRFLDKTSKDPTALVIENRNNAAVNEFTDRVYVGALHPLPAAGQEKRTIQIICPEKRFLLSGFAKQGETIVPADLVMWNPWEAKAKEMSDFDDDGFKQMLCIEPGLVSAFHTLPAGETMHLVQTLYVATK